MRHSPIVHHTCQYCGKRITLYEDDFLSTIGRDGRINYFYECPNCQEVDVIDEDLLPGYLKDILVFKANQKETENIAYLCVFFAIGMVAILYYLGMISVYIFVAMAIIAIIYYFVKF